jgi:hypothetical protein
MITVVSGTHASGKTSLIDAFVSAHPQADFLPDPVEMLGDYPTDPGADVVELAGTPGVRLAALERLMFAPGR